MSIVPDPIRAEHNEPPADEHVRPYVYQDQARTVRALHFSLSEIQSRMRMDDPDGLDLAYTQRMMGFLLWQPRPASIALIGLGGGSLVKFCHRHLPGSTLRVAEINPHVIALRDDFGIPPDSARLRVVCQDGAVLVRDPPQRFDVLLVDGFDWEGLPDALCSQAFYDDCAGALTDTGWLVANLPSSASQPLFAVHVARIRQTFGADAVLVVGDGERGTNSVVLACRNAQALRRPGISTRRPAGFDVGAWAALQPAMDAVRAALGAHQSEIGLA
ncbi:transferase [uncultured Sphaerotilus sp.]|uniref:transferase n=1 Tax=uncultured Sphaerotilus sp. TaxID=474984 RepID=UPI0030CA3EE0